MSPAAIAATVAALGGTAALLYFAFKPAPKKKAPTPAYPQPVPVPGPSLEPLPVPPKPVPPGPGGITPDVGLPSEPAEGWQILLTPLTAQQALEEVRQEATAATGEQAVDQALAKVFPGVEWNDPLSPWQTAAKSFMWIQFQGMVDWAKWNTLQAPFDVAFVLWLQTDFAITYCRNQGNVTDADVTLCAANLMFPNNQWPPMGTSFPWQSEAWLYIAGKL